MNDKIFKPLPTIKKKKSTNICWGRLILPSQESLANCFCIVLYLGVGPCEISFIHIGVSAGVVIVKVLCRLQN